MKDGQQLPPTLRHSSFSATEPLLLGAAFDQLTLAPWQVTYAVLYPVVCVAGFYWAAKAMFAHYVIAR